MKKYILISFTIHLLLAFFIFIPNLLSSPQNEMTNGDIAEDVIEIEVQKGSSIKTIERKCKDDKWYGGIGVLADRNTITRVFKGYVAEKSGLMVGDVIISGTDYIRGEPGTSINIIVARNGNIEEFSLIRERICLE